MHDYLELPPAFARLQPVRDEKTARDILIEQLDPMQEELEGILGHLNARQIDRLEVYGRLLEQRFGRGNVFGE